MTDHPDTGREGRPGFRRLIKRFHPEAIPGPAALVYNWLSSMNVFRDHYSLVAEHVSSFVSEGRLLDIGTGPGRLLVALNKKIPGLEMTGLDISAAMVRTAMKNVAASGLSDRIDVIQGNASKLPFEDGRFDLVVSTGSIHHWKEPVRSLKEIGRVLRPGGYALIYDAVTDTPKELVRESASRFGRFKVFLLLLHSFEEPFYTRAGLEDLGRGSGFKETKSLFIGLLCGLILRKGPEPGK